MILSPQVTFLNKRAVCSSHMTVMTSEVDTLGYRLQNLYPSFPHSNCARLLGMEGRRIRELLCPVVSNSVPDDRTTGFSSGSEDGDDDDETCPVDCVREFKTDEEFLKILEKAKKHNTLVVVDFYRTSCGSCRYIEHGFVKLCKVSSDHEDAIIFLKHNVIDEYDEPSEVADRLRIKKVPLFHFYKDGVLLEEFATRDKERIVAAITKYLSPSNAL